MIETGVTTHKKNEQKLQFKLRKRVKEKRKC